MLARYLRLYAAFMRFSFMRTLEFRFDFVIRILMDLVYYTVSIAFFRILFLHTPSLGGWNEDQSLIFASGYCLLDAVVMTIFANNMWWFPQIVNRGDLDYYLVRPVSSLFFLALREFSASSFMNLLCALGLMTWAMMRASASFSAVHIALFLILIVNGAFLFFCLQWLALMLVFWSPSPRGLGEAAWSLSRFAERPDRIYTGWVKRILTTALPYALMVSYPARILFEGFDGAVFARIIAVDVGIFGVVLLVWSRALRAYSSASS